MCSVCVNAGGLPRGRAATDVLIRIPLPPGSTAVHRWPARPGYPQVCPMVVMAMIEYDEDDAGITVVMMESDA